MRKGTLPAGVTVFPIHYEPGIDTGLIWRQTQQNLTKPVVITEFKEVPPDIRKHFPYALSYHMHLFPNPIHDHPRSGSYVFGFIFMEQDLK